MSLPNRYPLAVVAVGLLAAVVGSLHATGVLFAANGPSTALLAAGVSGLVLVFAGCANLPVERTRRVALRLFAASVLVYVPWLAYAMTTATKPVPLDFVGGTLSALLAVSVAAAGCAGAVLAFHRFEILLGWHDPPEKRLLSESEYRAFRDGRSSE